MSKQYRDMTFIHTHKEASYRKAENYSTEGKAGGEGLAQSLSYISAIHHSQEELRSAFFFFFSPSLMVR